MYTSVDNKTETALCNINVSLSLRTPKVCRKFCLNKWNAPFRISTSSDRPVECYFRMEFSNYPPSSPCFLRRGGRFSLYSEKYHLKKIPLKVAKGTISPNLATVRLYHSNKHSVVRRNAGKRNCSSALFLYFGVPLSFSLLSRMMVNPSSF